MKSRLHYVVAGLVAWAVIQVVVLNVCASLINSRLSKLEVKLKGTRNYLDETKPWFDETTLDLAKIHDRLNKLEAPEIFPEPNDPESCK